MLIALFINFEVSIVYSAGSLPLPVIIRTGFGINLFERV